jgi:hypothetical protein
MSRLDERKEWLDAGLGTTTEMWDILVTDVGGPDPLHGTNRLGLPRSMFRALYALADGRARVEEDECRAQILINRDLYDAAKRVGVHVYDVGETIDKYEAGEGKPFGYGDTYVFGEFPPAAGDGYLKLSEVLVAIMGEAKREG